MKTHRNRTGGRSAFALSISQARTAGLAAAVVTAGCIAGTGPALSTEYTWAGPGSFSNPSFWSPGIPPQNANIRFVDIGPGAIPVTDDLNLPFHSLTFDTQIDYTISSGGSTPFLGLNTGIAASPSTHPGLTDVTIFLKGPGQQTLNIDSFVLTNDQSWLQTGAGATMTVNNSMVLNGSVLSVYDSGGDAFTVNADIGGTGGGIRKFGTGTLTLNGANAFDAGLEINAGTVAVSQAAGAGRAADQLTLNGGTLRATNSFILEQDATLSAGGGAISVDSGRTLTHDGQLVGSGDLTKTGTGTLVLNGNNGAFSGDINVDAGALRISTNANIGGNGGTLRLDNGTLGVDGTFTTQKFTVLGSGGGTIDVAAGNTFTHRGGIFGSGTTLTKTGSGTLSLGGIGSATASNGYTDTRIEGGTLQVQTNGNLGQTSGTLTIDGGTLRTSASFSTARDTTLGSGNGAFNTDSGTTLTHNGAIGGSGALIKTGAGTLVLNGTNTYAGNTQISAGTLQISQDANLGQAGDPIGFNGGALRTTSTMTLTRQLAMSPGGGTLDVASGTTLTHNGLVSGTDSLTKTGTGTLVLTGAANTHRGTEVTGGTLSIANDNQLGNTNYALTLDGGTLRNTSTFLASSRDIVVGANGGTIETGNLRYMQHSGEISGGILTKTGVDTLELTGAANTHAGTVVAGGTLKIGGDAQLGAANAGLTLSGGTLGAASSFTMAHDIAVGPGSGIVSVSGAGNTVTQTADVAGAGNFAKSGTGTFAMAAGGTTALTGATTVSSGTLRVEGRTAGFDGGFTNNASGRTEIEGAAVNFGQGATNNGTFVSNNSVVTFGAGFVNNGALITDPNTMNFTNWTNNGTATTVAAAGDQFNVSGNLLGNTTNNTGWDTDEAILRFIAGDDDAHTLQLYGIDLGVSLAGLVDNFAWGTMALDAGQTVALEDIKADGNAGALYLDTILLADFASDIGDSVLDAIVGNGFNIYYNGFAAANVYLGGLTYNLAGGGQLIAYEGAGNPPPTGEVPEPAGLALFGMGVLGLGWARRKRRAA